MMKRTQEIAIAKATVNFLRVMVLLDETDDPQQVFQVVLDTIKHLKESLDWEIGKSEKEDAALLRLYKELGGKDEL